MTRPRRHSIRGKKSDSVLTLSMAGIAAKRFVYVLCADRTIKYGKQRSRIIYIGMSEISIGRTAHSIVRRARMLEGEGRARGIKVLSAYVVQAGRRQGSRLWEDLEALLLFEFGESYGRLPYCNKQQPKRPTASQRIRPAAIRKLLKQFES
jgi:hypothetical protein